MTYVSEDLKKYADSQKEVIRTINLYAIILLAFSFVSLGAGWYFLFKYNG